MQIFLNFKKEAKEKENIKNIYTEKLENFNSKL